MAQSRRCFVAHPRRYVYDVRRLGMPQHGMSLTFAVAIAHLMGCRSARLLAMDSVKGDFRTVVGSELRTIGRGYLHAAGQATRLAAKIGLELEWV
jgi:hypothetical protein